MNVLINTPGSGSPAMSGAWTGTNVTLDGLMTGPAKLGTDLSNDHPVSMQYGGGGISSSTLDGVTKDPDFAQVGTTTGLVNTQVLGSGLRVWYIETAGNTDAGQHKDDIALYSRTDGSGGSNPGINQPFVECASCHDPHSNNSTFLRVTNTGSAVCLTCHAK